VAATVGIDLGGTKVQAVLVDGDDLVADVRTSTPAGGPEAVVEAIAALLADLGSGAKGVPIGVGAPGVIDPRTGVLHRAPNLPGFDAGVALGPMVAEATGAERVVVANDANVAVVAEHVMGAGRGAADVLGVWVGTGVGGGFVLDGRLRVGPSGLTGEIGHVVVVDGGRRCACGLDGHLEAYAGRAGMEKEARRRYADGEATLLVELAGEGRMKSGIFAKALEAGDRVAEELLEEAVQALGVALSTAATLIDLQRIVVGGGVAEKLGVPYVARIGEATRRRLLVPETGPEVLPAELGDLAGALGAALLVR
jgi:glucokinase